MEMPIVKSRLVKNILFATALFALVSFTPRKADPVVIGEIGPALYVQFLGGNNEALFFNVKYNNKERKSFRLSALDENGEAWFQQNYTAKAFDKKITVPRMTDTDYVIFLVRSSKENIQLTYKVKVTTKVDD
jgi:hypothetical protein